MNGVMIRGRPAKVNKALSADEKAAAGIPSRGVDERGGGGPHRHKYGGEHSDRHAPRRKGYRVALSGLPEHYTWRELKDLLRTTTGFQPIYTNVDKPGHGYCYRQTPGNMFMFMSNWITYTD